MANFLSEKEVFESIVSLVKDIPFCYFKIKTPPGPALYGTRSKALHIVTGPIEFDGYIPDKGAKYHTSIIYRDNPLYTTDQREFVAFLHTLQSDNYDLIGSIHLAYNYKVKEYPDWRLEITKFILTMS